ncbi:MAG: OmpH family outer membrane protein [Muribaculaceae bacterium]|nr:OmpH family outer membrane protein [Muribaculaceae bacterium]
MIKKLLLAVMIAIPAFGFAQKFAIVDTQNIIEVMPEMASARTQLQAASDKYETEFKKLQETLQASITEYQKVADDANTPQSIKDRRVKDIQEMQQKIEEFRATATQDLQKQQEQLMTPVQQKLMDAIKAVGTDGGYTMVFENVMPLYTGTDVEDITPKIKTRLGIK